VFDFNKFVLNEDYSKDTLLNKYIAIAEQQNDKRWLSKLRSIKERMRIDPEYRSSVNEEIIANGKSLDTEDDKNDTANYTDDDQDGANDNIDNQNTPAPTGTEHIDGGEDSQDDTTPNYTTDNPDANEVVGTDGAPSNPDDTTTGEEGDDDLTPNYGDDNLDDGNDNTTNAGTPGDNGAGDDNTGGNLDSGLDNNDDPNTDGGTGGGDDDLTPNYGDDNPGGDDGTVDGGGTDGDDGTGSDPNVDGGTGEGDDDSTPNYGDERDGDDGTGTGDDVQGGGEGDDEIKQMETELFSNMSPEQIEIKQTELKTQFVSLYANIEKCIDRLSKVNRVEDNIRPIEFVTRKLLELKDLVRDSLIQSYDTRSYVENQIILQRHMAIFSTLTNILEELGKNKK
jgi:hypothetical protein